MRAIFTIQATVSSDTVKKLHHKVQKFCCRLIFLPIERNLPREYFPEISIIFIFVDLAGFDS